MIRWCLLQDLQFKADYEQMRAAGNLHLPTGQTLHDYSVLSKPKTGWQAETQLHEMSQQRDDLCKDGVYEKCGQMGRLFFDGVNIEECIAFDTTQLKLVGFVDFHSKDLGDDEARLARSVATNVKQFYF